MSLAENASNFLDRIRRDGVRAALAKAAQVLRDRLVAPAETFYWLAVSEVTRLDLPPGGALRVVRSLDELTADEQCAVERSIGTSSLEIWRQRLGQGLEAYLLFIGGRLVASRFVIWGSAHPFHHVLLTPKDTMSMDLRVDPDFRGKGAATAFFSQSLQDLGRRGCERAYATVAVNNEPVNRMVLRLGFRALVRWRRSRGGYRYERDLVH